MSTPRLQETPGQDRRDSPWWGIHEARYQFALNHVSGEKLLDIACGTGYGLPILLGAVRFVVGMDLDFDALRSFNRQQIRGRGSLTLGDGCLLPFRDHSFEAVTSFETIEHLYQRTRFIAELARVLAPKGVCVLSTPNAIYTRPPNGTPRNPYHVYEYNPTEFYALLARYFVSVELFGQRLRPEFRISPFWDDQQRLRTVPERCRLFVWRILNRLPRSTREFLSRVLWGHPFIPSTGDYQFVASVPPDSPVQLAICRSPIR
jgi:SAM-dependent methyltransferase